MARSVEEINQYVTDAVVTNFASIGITIDTTLWSKRNILRAICYTIAIAQNLLEQLMDAYMIIVLGQVKVSAAASPAWVQDKMFKFQYSDTDPQYVVMIGGVPQYPTVDATLNIITACSVTSNTSNVVNVKIATGSPLQAVSLIVLQAAQGYLNTIGTAGIVYNVVSKNPDQLYLNAIIYYQGQYAPVITSNTIAMLDAWAETQSNVNFNGKVKVSDLEKIILSIPGVDDVELLNVRGRADSVDFTSGIDLVKNEQTIQRLYTTDAGYFVFEETDGETLLDSLIFQSV